MASHKEVIHVLTLFLYHLSVTLLLGFLLVEYYTNLEEYYPNFT